MTTARVYRGISRREHDGWIMGLTGPQAFSCVVLAFPVVWAVSIGHWWQALWSLLVCGLLTALVVVPVRGRPAFRWLGHWVLYQLGVATGWSRWLSKTAAGEPVRPEEPDLPGVLTRITFPDGPPFRADGRVCLIHDTAEGRWGATARLTHGGVGLTGDEVRELLAARLGTMLLAVGQRGIVDRLSIYVRSVPDDGTEYDIYRRRHQADDAPKLATEVTEEISRRIGNVSMRHEVFMTVSGREDALRKPAQHAGGGIAGRAYVLYRAMDGLEDPLKSLGVQSIEWLDGAGMAEAIRTGFNPMAAGVLTTQRLSCGGEGLPMAASGPTQAPSPQIRSYVHDGCCSVAYTLLMPTSGAVFGSLAPILAVRSPGERRTLAVHYEVEPDAVARKDVQAQRFRNSIVRDLKSRRGFSRTAADERQADGAVSQERAVDAGHGLVRSAWAASITVPADRNIEDHAARMENDAAGRFRLLRLELAQDSAFVAACIPVGVGLPRKKGGLL